MNPRRYFHPRYAAVLSVGLSLGLVDTASAAPPEIGSRAKAIAKPMQPVATTNASQEARLLLQDAHTLSQSAQSTEELSELISLCDDARNMPLGEVEAKFADDLLAWAYNRRGEALANRAAELIEQQAAREAVKFDRQALEDFNAAIEIDPQRWKAIHNRGVSYGVLGRHAEATADFTRVIELKRDYANAWFNRAEIHFENGRYSVAVKDYTEAIRLKPQDAAAYRGRGRSLAKIKRTDDALEELTRALEIDPLDSKALVDRGEVNRQLGNWENAAVDFRDAVEADPENAHAYRGAAWLMSTCPLPKYRNSKLALEAAEKAAEAAEQQGVLDHTFHDTLAAANANAGRFAEARRAAEEALRLAPEKEKTRLESRLATFIKQRPYRDGSAPIVKNASTTVERR